MKFELKKYARSARKDYQKTTDDELIADLRDVAGKLQKDAVTSREYDQRGKFNSHIFERRFGSWLNALGKAGLQKTRNYNITDEEAFQNLEKIVVYINNEGSASSEEAIKNLEIEPDTQHKTTRGVNERLRFIVMRRDNFKCKNCGRSPATDSSIILHVDHIKAWANGGETVLENLQTLCSVCNIGKSDLE